MPTNFDVSVEGDKELEYAMRTLPGKLQKKGIRVATRDAAKVVLADAKRLAPHESGDLERSLTVKTAKQSNGKKLPRNVFGHAVITREGLFQGDQFYGGFLEYGTQPRRTAAGHYRGTIDHNFSFIRPALYDNAARVKAIFRARLRRALRNLVEKRKKI